MKRFIFIGAAIVFSKIVFLVIPYITNDVEYNDFNKIYYSAAIVVLFAKLGFEFAINRIDISHKHLFISIFTNTLITTLFISFFNSEFDFVLTYAAIFIYSLFYILANIFLIKNLFDGLYKHYFAYKMFYGISILGLLFFIVHFNFDIFLVLPIAGIIWFIFVYSFNYRNKDGKGSIKDFYKLGLSGFVINAAIGFAFIADKYIVNHFFELNTANAYTFAWALTAPILYVGTMTEHSIFSADNVNRRRTIIRAVAAISILSILYASFLYGLVYFYPNILPKTIDRELLLPVLSIFLLIYLFYTIIQYPLNGLLFKYIDERTQFIIAKIYPIPFLLFLFFLYMIIDIGNDDYFKLIILCSGYLFTLLFIKGFFIKRTLSK